MMSHNFEQFLTLLSAVVAKPLTPLTPLPPKTVTSFMDKPKEGKRLSYIPLGSPARKRFLFSLRSQKVFDFISKTLFRLHKSSCNATLLK